jgi:hypothetical protein
VSTGLGKTFSREEVEGAIAALRKYLLEKSREADAQVYAVKHSASEFYLSDMKGYSRGIYHSAQWAVSFLTDLFTKET